MNLDFIIIDSLMNEHVESQWDKDAISCVGGQSCYIRQVARDSKDNQASKLRPSLPPRCLQQRRFALSVRW